MKLAAPWLDYPATAIVMDLLTRGGMARGSLVVALEMRCWGLMSPISTSPPIYGPMM